MPEIYQTELERGLELRLEQIACPLNQRIYYGTKSHNRFFAKGILTNAFKVIKTQHPELGLDKDRLNDPEYVKQILTHPSLDGLLGKADPKFYQLLAKNAVSIEDFLLSRESLKNGKGFYVQYIIHPSGAEVEELFKLPPDRRVEVINDLIKNTKYLAEQILITDEGDSVLGLWWYKMNLAAPTISMRKGKIKKRASVDKDKIYIETSIDPEVEDQKIFDIFDDLHNQPANAGKVIQKVSDFMRA